MGISYATVLQGRCGLSHVLGDIRSRDALVLQDLVTLISTVTQRSAGASCLPESLRGPSRSYDLVAAKAACTFV